MEPDIANNQHDDSLHTRPTNTKEESGDIDDVFIESYNDSPPAKKGFGDTLSDLRAKLDKCKLERQEYLDGWQRAKADYANLKKREEEGRVEYSKFAKESMIDELIPVLESFSMAKKNKDAWEKVDASWRAGIDYIHTQLLQVMTSNGLSEVTPLGEKFDPNRDNAIATIPTAEKLQDHIIAEVVQAGYQLNGKLIRSPQVRVYEYRENQ